MNFLIALFMAFMVYAMFVIDHHLCQLGEKLDDIKTLTELKRKYTEKEK